MWGLGVIRRINMDPGELTPQVLGLLERVRIAVVEERLSDAERLMIQAKDLLHSGNPDPLPARRKAGWV